MILIAGLLGGAAAGALCWKALSPVWRSEILQRRNFRDRQLPVGGGLVIVAAVLVVEAAFALGSVAAGEGPPGRSAAALLLAVGGFALLGLVDDLVGSDSTRGLSGHFREAASGRLTTGGLKLLGGACISVLTAATAVPGSAAQLIVDAVLIAAAANLVNLLDLAPGRAIKVAGGSFIVLACVTGLPDEVRAPAVAVGAALALLWPDLRERVMLGDTGSNPLGAALGLTAVLALPATGRTVAAVVLVILNLVSERTSFSRVIDTVPFLRAMDRLGRSE